MRDPIVTIYHEDGGFTLFDRRKEETVADALNATALILELGRMIAEICTSCGEKLRKSEGDGPCSDCHDAQCKEASKLSPAERAMTSHLRKTEKEEAPAAAS